MENWTSGYVADIAYTYGYYAELNPLRTKLALLNAGVEPATLRNACELGFGQGVSVNMHAAGNLNTTWYGTDFNPSQAGFGQMLASASGSNAQLYDQSFKDFCAREDLPEFDYIAMHGIWSWVSDENRSIIADFILRKLAVGGVLYISYNTLPGWATAAPLRHLLSRYADEMTGTGQGILKRVDESLDFAQTLIDTNPLYTVANPRVSERFKQIKSQDKAYLAHEYFNHDWVPMYYADVEQFLAPAKVSFACSSHLLDHIESINLTNDQQKLLSQIPSSGFKQTARDFMVNQQFRKDYWIKGTRTIDVVRQQELIAGLTVILTTPRSDVKLEVQGTRGKATLNEPIYTAILDALDGHKILSIGELARVVANKNVPYSLLIEGITVLSGMGHLYTTQDPETTNASAVSCQKINEQIIMLSRAAGDLKFLASPVIGGGFPVTRFQQLFLLAIQKGMKKPTEWASFVWDILKAQNRSIIKDGKALSTPEENLAELNEQARQFEEKHLPILKALKIA